MKKSKKENVYGHKIAKQKTTFQRACKYSNKKEYPDHIDCLELFMTAGRYCRVCDKCLNRVQKRRNAKL